MARAQADLSQTQYLVDQANKLKALDAITETDYRTATFNVQMAEAGVGGMAFALGGLGLSRSNVILGGRPALAAAAALCAMGAGAYLSQTGRSLGL